MSPDMTNDPGQMLGVALGAWLLCGWVYRRGIRRAVAYLAKRAGKEQR